MPGEVGHSIPNRVLVRESVRVVVAYDDEWDVALGAEAESWSRLLVSLVSGEFRGVGLHLLPVRVVRWVSPAALLTASEVTEELAAAVPVGDADMVLGLTATEMAGSADGYGEVGGRYAIVAHHPGHPERDVMVAAHEIAHLFGATHGCDAQRRTGLMAEQGFAEPDILCLRFSRS